MIVQQYSVNQHPIQTLLSWINSKEIAIPEIQRPFVWDATKVRDLLDSLYSGYPIGYLIIWKNPNVKLKDGKISEGKKILIDGQQRITALMTSILGQEIVDKDYQRKRIAIAFHPQSRKFEVSNPVIQKDKSWISDISKVFAPDFKTLNLINEYCEKNDFADKNSIFDSIEFLRGIVNNPIGVIELDSHLDIETVTEIFIRINSQGVILSQADFAMSKIAVNESYGGNLLRKAIDYFCHLAKMPEFYNQLTKVDNDFTNTDYFKKMSWLKYENDNLYDPSYTDVLRVAFSYKFKRGRLQDLVAFLSGRNFETREYEEPIAEESFRKLREGFLDFINENKFKKFLMIIRSAGFIESSMITSLNAVNFAYVLYHTLLEKNFRQNRIESLVRKWFVLSVLKSRYSNSPDSQFDYDIRQLDELGVETYIQNTIEAELSDAYWELALLQQLNTSVSSNPAFKAFLAAQVKANDKGFLSKEITVRDLISLKGDVHHIFPKGFLKKNGLNRTRYNQVANYVMTQTEINIAIGNKPPSKYFKEIFEQCSGGKIRYGGITDKGELLRNFKANCIPANIIDFDIDQYDKFLEIRRKLIARKIKDYFFSL